MSAQVKFIEMFSPPAEGGGEKTAIVQRGRSRGIKIDRFNILAPSKLRVSAQVKFIEMFSLNAFTHLPQAGERKPPTYSRGGHGG